MKGKVFLGCAMFLILSLSINAQESENSFGFELNTGSSFATNETINSDFNTGFGFEGILHYNFMPHMGVYGGWGWNRFSSGNSFVGKDACFEETGYVLGLQFKHPIEGTSISYYLRVGGMYKHIEIENEDGKIIEDSGHGLGFQLVGGIDLPIGSNWSITPNLKFNSLSREINFGELTKQLNYKFIAVSVGILKKF